MSLHPLSHAHPAGGLPPANPVRALADDAAAFENVRQALTRYALSLLGSADDAEDAVQSAIERGLRSAPPGAEPLAWLMAVTRNLCVDAIRCRARSGCAADALDSLRAASDPEHEVLTRSRLLAALATLSPAERRAAHATWMLDQSSMQAARSLGMADSTVRVLLARARRKLALHLEDAGRSVAGLGPWLLGLPHRAARRVSDALRLDPILGDRWISMAAPTTALIVAATSVAVLTQHPEQARGAATAGPTAGTAVLGASGGAPGGAAATSSSGGPLGSLLPGHATLHPQRPRDAAVTDVQASPDYSQDHTVLAVASDNGCQLPPCSELLVSTDGGHSWALRTASNARLRGTQLLLPPATFGRGVFYAFGSAGLQITQDGGAHFQTLDPYLPGYAGLMPPGLQTYVSVANVSLWNFATAATPGLAGAYPAGTEASGPAIAVGGPAGWTLLQPVVQSLAGPEEVLACGGGTCTAGTPLPWSSGLTHLYAGADGRTVVAAGSGLAISRDSGQTFQPLATPAGTAPTDVAVVSGPAGARVVATLHELAFGSAREIAYTDDGTTWHAASLSIDAGLRPELLRSLDQTDLMVALEDSTGGGLVHRYLCSADAGSTWSSC